jgi:hypothetical protein
MYTDTPTTPLQRPRLAAFSLELAVLLGFDPHSESFLQQMAGHETVDGFSPKASVYSGHQFGVWAGQLGDGRAHLIGERSGLQLQLKGAGATPYSRRADGRAVLRSSIREYLCSEAMHALNIPTTRAVALVHSDTPVRRERLETAAVVCRVAPSFLRFGHVEHLHDQPEALKKVLDDLRQRFYPECADTPALLRAIVEKTAALMAAWMSVGFCHGVMNTDNFSLLGLTLDYGPFGFIDAFDPNHICNHSDESGRYSFGNQPAIGYWNCARLIEACLSQLEGGLEAAQDLLKAYPPAYQTAMMQRWRGKFGLVDAQDGDEALINRFLHLLKGSDFTRVFWAIKDGYQATKDEIVDVPAFEDWWPDYQARLSGLDATAVFALQAASNPKVVLRNHLAETAIQCAEAGDYSEITRLQERLARPFDDLSDDKDADYPPAWAQSLAVSCSS